MADKEEEDERKMMMKRRKRWDPFNFHSQLRQKRQQQPLFNHKKKRWSGHKEIVNVEYRIIFHVIIHLGIFRLKLPVAGALNRSLFILNVKKVVKSRCLPSGYKRLWNNIHTNKQMCLGQLLVSDPTLKICVSSKTETIPPVRATICKLRAAARGVLNETLRSTVYVAQKSNFSETGSYFMRKISSGFSSDALRVLSLNSVIPWGSWKQQTKAAAEQHQVVPVFCPAFTGLAHWQMEKTLEPETSQWAM